MRLPKYVTIERGWYVYRPWDRFTRRWGKRSKLAPENARYGEIMDAYHRAVGKSVHSFRTLFFAYERSERYKSLAIRTQKDYYRYLTSIDKQRLENGQSLLDVPFYLLNPPLFRRYLDIRPAKTQGNRELQFMKAVFSWGYERGFCPNNPVKGVRLNPTPPRTRYVTHDEFMAVFNQASPRIQLAMLLAWKCRLRRKEVLNLRMSHIEDGYLRCERLKGSKTTLVKIDADMRKAIDSYPCRSDVVKIDPFLVHDGNGKRTKDEAFSSEWQRLIRNFDPRFTFHDLKAKGISDDTDDKQIGSGHKSASMVNVYDRRPAKVEPIK